MRLSLNKSWYSSCLPDSASSNIACVSRILTTKRTDFTWPKAIFCRPWFNIRIRFCSRWMVLRIIFATLSELIANFFSRPVNSSVKRLSSISICSIASIGSSVLIISWRIRSRRCWYTAMKKRTLFSGLRLSSEIRNASRRYSLSATAVRSAPNALSDIERNSSADK